jgi:TRAP transporter TAXI family solute receptor
MQKRLSASFVVAAMLALFASGSMAVDAKYKIVTASERGTYIQIGKDLAKLVAPAAGIELQALPSVGSSENVERLRYESGVKLAMVQSDVYQAFLDLAANGNAEAGAMIRPLRVVMPLYNEEIYFIARSDSALNFVHEIKAAKINVGPLRSGTAMSATTIFRQMFGAPIAEANASYLSNEDALVQLTVDKTIDVVVVVGGQPTKLLVDMKPEARALIKLLKFDADRPESKAALQTYFAANVRAASYPSLLAEDVPSVAVRAYLVTYDYKLSGTVNHLGRFAQSLCQNFAQLQTQGHPKWREVELRLPELGQGWLYYAATERTLRNCIAKLSNPKPVRSCAQQERVLGLCK